jgi:hypothetical protein
MEPGAHLYPFFNNVLLLRSKKTFDIMKHECSVGAKRY